MLVSHNKVSGYRQVVLHKGKLFFARVAQASNDDGPAVAAGNVEQEIMNTLEYLRRMGLHDDGALELFIVTAQDVVEKIEPKSFGALRTELFVPSDLSEQLGLQQAALSGDRYGDVLMVAGFNESRKKSLKLSVPYADTLAKMSSAILAVTFLIAIFVLGSLGYVGMQVPGVLKFSEEYAGLQAEEKQKIEELTRIKGIASELPDDARAISLSLIHI